MIQLILISIFLLTVLSLWYCFHRPMAIPAVYLFISNFFVVDFSPLHLPLNTSKLFLIPLLFYFFWQAIKQKKSSFQWKPFYPLLLFYGLSFFIPALFHLFIFDYWPSLYFSVYAKSLWGLGILFIPEEKRDLRQAFIYLFICFILSLILITPGSIYFFLKTGEGLGRIFSSSTILSPNDKWLRPFWQWFVMDDNTSENISLTMAIFFPWLLSRMFINPKKWWMIVVFIVTVPLLFFILLSNQYMMCIAVWIIQMFFCLFFFRKQLFSFYHPRFLLFIPFTFMIILMIQSVQKNPFFLNRWTYNEKLPISNQNRITLITKYSKQWLKTEPLKGLGYPKTFEHRPDQIANHTGHSTIIDQWISFGFPLGLISSFLFFYPLILIFQRRLLLSQQSFVFSSLICFFVTFLFLSTETIFGRESLQLGSVLFILSLLQADKHSYPTNVHPRLGEEK
jgi:hypothetical protein